MMRRAIANRAKVRLLAVGAALGRPPPEAAPNWMFVICGIAVTGITSAAAETSNATILYGKLDAGSTRPISVDHCSHAADPQKSSTHMNPPFNR